MGCFGYICKGCGTSVRGDCWGGGEKTIMIHVRHGEEMGRVEGHYDEYGRVVEQKDLIENLKFRGEHKGINGRREIGASEIELEDSLYRIEKIRVYRGVEVDFSGYVTMVIKEEEQRTDAKLQNSPLYDMLTEETKEAINNPNILAEVPYEYKVRLFMDELRSNFRTPLYDRFKRLRKAKREVYSGMVVWHSKCYREATQKEKENLTPSKSDPNQSWGRVRNKYK
jgi:hypothetical protein